MISRELLLKAMPPALKSAATQDLADKLNNIQTDPLVAEQIRENFISYTGVLKDGKFKTEDYLTAVAYVSFKLMGMSNLDAYIRTFPDRYQTLVSKSTPSNIIAAHVTSYNKGKLVNLILEQSMVPTWVLNADVFQKAVNTQLEIMTNPDVNARDRTAAANSLLTHLKRPEAVKAEISLELKENSGMNEMRKAMEKMAEQQRDLIGQGVPTALIAAQPIVEAEFDEVEAEEGTDETKP